jgi:Holliday junction resolvase RusA-like endonuclease
MKDFLIPIPTSVNAMFANSEKGRVKTEAYREWRKKAESVILSQDVPRFEGTFEIRIAASDRGLTRRRDIDNIAKSSIDVLVHCGVIIKDDHLHLRSVKMRWTSDIPHGMAMLTVEQITKEPIKSEAKAMPSKKKKDTPEAISKALKARGINVLPSKIHVQ